jgi:hypothetical protein
MLVINLEMVKLRNYKEIGGVVPMHWMQVM